MAVDTAGFRKHDQVRAYGAELRTVAERLPELTTVQREKELRRLLRYLRDRVDPRTEVDELLLYPQVSERLGDPLIAVSMNYDHLAIRHWISKIAATDITDTDRLRQLLYGLDALIAVRTWKENELFLALLNPHHGRERVVSVTGLRRCSRRELTEAARSSESGRRR